MFGKDYQVLDIDYAVTERRRADITQNKELVDLNTTSSLTILGVLFLSDLFYCARAAIFSGVKATS